jgi:pantetheine-phosphate adenylyltransferase
MKKEYKYWNWAQEHLIELGVSTDVMNRYNEEHRFYHSWWHIEDLFQQIEKRNLLDNDALFLATIFHDSVYDPKAQDNEEKSANLFLQMYKGDLRIEVEKIILDTKHHRSSGDLSNIFTEMDLDILSRPFNELIEYEHKIFKEFQFVDYETYKEKRIEVLRELQKASEGKLNLESLITYVGSRTPSIGLYCGSFDPFTIGHYNILTKAENIFDKVIIARGKNPDKGEYQYPMPERIQYRQVESYKGLLTDLIKRLGHDVTLVRGLRNATDLQNEMTQFRFLQDMMPNVKMVTIFCDKEFEHISSSAVRQLKSFGKDSKYMA